MQEDVLARRDASLTLVTGLIRRGRELSADLQKFAAHTRVDHSDDGGGRRDDLSMAVRSWQQDCAAAINELSGGSKAHWLARAFSQAFLVSRTPESIIVEAGVAEIVDRLLAVLGEAAASLTGIGAGSAPAAPPLHRFDFVHNPQLRPVLEHAYRDSGRLFAEGAFQPALVTSCGVLEAILTDALEHLKNTRGTTDQKCEGESDAWNIGEWSFETRIVEAERAGLIRGGCRRLPPVARTYRVSEGGDGQPGASRAVSERDARLARQVLHVIMRDLDPGR